MSEVGGVALRSNPELRAAARKLLRGRWTNPVLVTLVSGLILCVGGSLRGIGPLISLLLGGPVMLGVTGFFLKMYRGQESAVEDVFAGFKEYVPALTLYLLMSVFTFLWSLLLIVPGIIAGLSYAMSFYILRDDPRIQAREALRMSSRMMMGHKGQLFLLSLSFIGWAFLCVLTMGIGFLWLGPYVSLSLAAFYEDLRQAGPQAA